MRRYLTAIALILAPISLQAHCQLPCGIYHDGLQFQLLDESIETLNKAIAEINSNSGKTTPLENNQLVRSVNLKDQYADKIAESMSFYFLQQRLKPGQNNLGALLNSAFTILQLSAKVKSTVDANLVSQLNQEIANFKSLYMQKH